MDSSSIVAMIVSAAAGASALSFLATALTRYFFVNRVSERERLQIKNLERTLDHVAELRRRGIVSDAEMKDLIRKIIEVSLTEDRGERLLSELKDVRVEGGRSSQKEMLESAERSLHARFATPSP
jgi:hypothetical protein